MDTVKWGHTPAMEADDVLMSDNILEFVKDEDIVNPDEILPQGNSIKPTNYCSVCWRSNAYNE